MEVDFLFLKSNICSGMCSNILLESEQKGGKKTVWTLTGSGKDSSLTGGDEEKREEERRQENEAE